MATDDDTDTRHRLKMEQTGRRGPRMLRMSRSECDFGFTLRHFIVYPPESYQVLAGDRLLGLRLSEGRGDDPLETVFVKSVRAGSPAASAGLCTGDRILAVNGEPTVHRPYSYVVQLVQASKQQLSLLVVSKDEDVIQQYFGETAHKPETNSRRAGTGRRLCSPEMQRSAALSVGRRSLEDPHTQVVCQHNLMAAHHHHHSLPPSLRPPLSPAHAFDYDSPRSPDRVLPPHLPAPVLEYDSRLAEAPPGCRLSFDGVSPSRESFSHSSDDSLIISRIIKSCEQKEEFLKRPVAVNRESGGVRSTEGPVWPSVIPGSAVVPAAPPSPVPFVCGGAVSNPPMTVSHHRPTAMRLVSERARQFENGQCQADRVRLFKSELSRLGQTNNGGNVAVRRREFETRTSTSDWRTQRQSTSLDSTLSHTSSLSGSEVSSSTTCTPVAESGTPLVHLSGNRTIPVGATRPHCPPPPVHYSPKLSQNEEVEGRPRSNSLGSVGVSRADDPADKRRNKAVRQDSYLAAVKKFVEKAGETSRGQSWPSLQPALRRSNLRSHHDEERSTRRESYLRATTLSNMDTDVDADTEPESPSPSHCRTAAYTSVTNQIAPCEKRGNSVEGGLTCKIILVEGKKCQDRSWKSVYAVLRGTVLYLFRDKKDSLSQSPVDYERIDMEGVSVSVADDYSKRRHVLKLSSVCSSEILLQADSQADMTRWLHALHHDNNNTQSLSSGGSTTSGGVVKSTGIGKLTFRNRSPTGHSPTSKTRKPTQSDGAGGVKTKNWSKRLTGGLMFKKSCSPLHYPDGATIGVPLHLCPQSSGAEYIPLLVELCTQIVEEKGLDIIGIYRVPGNTAAVSSLTEAVNRGLDSALLDQDQRWSDVNVISSLLKSFFRKLPDCLLTTELYPHFIEADKIQDPKKRVAHLRKLVHELPTHNYQTLRHLMFHLKTVVNHCGVNKMEARNLAIVFGPTLIKAADNNMTTLVNDMSHQCRIVETLILYVDWCFSEEGLEDLVLKEDASIADIHDSESNNQTLLLDNIHKVEGLKESPTRDMSAKDIVSSIISAANRKMQKARRGKSIVSIAEENTTDPDPSFVKHRSSREVGGGSRGDGEGGLSLSDGCCREEETTTHGATRPNDGSSSRSCVASHVRQSVLFSGSVASHILSSNHSHSLPHPEKEGDEGETEASSCSNSTRRVKSNSVEGGTIRSYTGLNQVTQERVRRFELETKAMLQREPLRSREASDTSLTAVGQSIAASREAVDYLGKRLKTCKQVDGSRGGSASVRKGSLDSLKDSGICWSNSPTSVSADESGDLVVSLTSTFDAKMKDLSVTKECSKVDCSSTDAEKQQDQLKPVDDTLNEEDFRDPSLHKSAANALTQCKSGEEGKTKEGEGEKETVWDKENCKTKLRRSESLNKREEKKDCCRLRRTESLNKRDNNKVDNKLKTWDSLTKNEKTESNLNKRRQLEAGKMYKMKRKTGGLNDSSIKRRHTVGGTKDFDKLTWLDNRQAQQSQNNRRTSSPDLSRHVLMEVKPCSFVQPPRILSKPLESHM